MREAKSISRRELAALMPIVIKPCAWFRRRGVVGITRRPRSAEIVERRNRHEEEGKRMQTPSQDEGKE